MDSLAYYRNSLSGYWPTARALSVSLPGAIILFIALLSIPIRKRLFGRRPMKLRIFVGGRRIPFFVRDGNDISALREIFADEEYVFNGLPFISPRCIADMGAHIGTTVLFLHFTYPNAKIIAYEPDPENFQLLKMNLGSLPQVECVNVAVAGTTGTIPFYPNWGGSTRSSTTRMKDSGEEIRVASVRVNDVITRGVDFVKFDVEGAEYEMFAAASNKNNVDRYVGEVHHKIIGKTQKEFENLFPGFSFVWKGGGADHSVVAISRNTVV